MMITLAHREAWYGLLDFTEAEQTKKGILALNVNRILKDGAHWEKSKDTAHATQKKKKKNAG